MMKKEKKGISPVIASVLLIFITFVAIGFLVAFLMPNIKEQLKKGVSCFELMEYFKILESDYTCYNSTATSLMIERGMEDYKVGGFAVSIFSEEESKRYDIAATKIPNPGEAKTYVFDTSGNNAEIASKTKDSNICQEFFYKIPECK